jgi:uncharacterized protein (UPF0332 family)
MSSSLNQEASRRFLEETKRIWFNPEIERLKQIGSVNEDYQPKKMQVILFPDYNRSILFDNDIISIEKLKANINYKDCSHVTFKKDVIGNWHGFFDFRYNKGKAKELFNTAQQFLDSAKDEYKARRLQVFADNLFSAAELFVQSLLFVESHNKRFADKPNHKWTTSEFSKFVKLGNMASRYSTALGQLSRLRDDARYHKREFGLEDSKAQEHIKTVEDLAEEVGRFIS